MKKCYVCEQTLSHDFFNTYTENDKIRFMSKCKKCSSRNKRDLIHKRIVHNLKKRLRDDYKIKNYVKTKNFDEIFGIRPLGLKTYIESLFLEGMTWENYGLWEVDHIIPLSHANNQEEYELYTNYKNIQPLWKKDNLKKKNKLTEESLIVLSNLKN